ncbi:MAG: chromosome partitioning protein ParA, partial [Staphylococcus lugdunensis]|nr:chromosome partitioning protein ParA [Staphylococcus lugdunensis]
MLSEENVSALVGAIKDPILNVPLSEINGIKEIKIKEEIEH